MMLGRAGARRPGAARYDNPLQADADADEDERAYEREPTPATVHASRCLLPRISYRKDTQSAIARTEGEFMIRPTIT